MADSVYLEIVTPEKMVVSEDVREVSAPGIEGEFGVLPEHTPFLSILKAGLISFKTMKNEVKSLNVTWGYAEVKAGSVIILAEAAERPEEIDVERALAAKKRAEERLGKGAEDIDIERAQFALARALSRIDTANKFGK